MVYIYRYTWTDLKTNIETAKELNTSPVLDKIQGYITLGRVNRMPHNRLPKIIKKNTHHKAERTREDH